MGAVAGMEVGQGEGSWGQGRPFPHDWGSGVGQASWGHIGPPSCLLGAHCFPLGEAMGEGGLPQNFDLDGEIKRLEIHFPCYYKKENYWCYDVGGEKWRVEGGRKGRGKGGARGTECLLPHLPRGKKKGRS